VLAPTGNGGQLQQVSVHGPGGGGGGFGHFGGGGGGLAIKLFMKY